MRRYWQYLKYVLRHKWYVFQGCRLTGVSLFSAILHDWDKFLPDMFIAYAKTFYTPDGAKQYEKNIGFTKMWMRHQHINKHHWQAWLKYNDIPIQRANIIVWDNGSVQMLYDSGEIKDLNRSMITADEMDDHDIREMVADWYGAGMALGKPDIYGWYSTQDGIILHPETRMQVDIHLRLLVAKIKERGTIEGEIDR